MNKEICKQCKLYTKNMQLIHHIGIDKDKTIFINENGCEIETDKTYDYSYYKLNFNKMDFKNCFVKEKSCPYYFEHEIYDLNQV